MLEVLLKDENWFPVVTPVTAFVAIAFLAIARRRRVPARWIIVGALNLFFGLWIGIMGTGHLFAVTTKMILGILPPNIHPWVALPFGLAIAIPGWWLAARIQRLVRGDTRTRKEAMWLNAWLATLLVVPAWPLVVLPLASLIALAWLGKAMQKSTLAGTV
jgi:hypothetical protein